MSWSRGPRGERRPSRATAARAGAVAAGLAALIGLAPVLASAATTPDGSTATSRGATDALGAGLPGRGLLGLAGKPTGTASGKPSPSTGGASTPPPPTHVAPPRATNTTPNDNGSGNGGGGGNGGDNTTCQQKLPGMTWYAGDVWAQDWLKFDRAWPYATGKGVKVAVVDSGFQSSPQFSGVHLAPIDESVSFLDGQRGGPGSAYIDCEGHGTEVASIIAAHKYDHGPGERSSFFGVAPQVTLLPIRVATASGAGKQQDLADGIVWAVDKGADIINVSIEGSNDYIPLRRAVAYAQQHNVLIVAASGNFGTADGGGQPAYPAQYATRFSNVISVGAADKQGQRSQFGQNTYSGTSGLTLMAPGSNLVAAWPGGGNDIGTDQSPMSGTSFAAPYVTGTAALIVEAYDHKLTPAQIRQRLELTADPAPGASLPDKLYGYGMLDPLEAVTAELDTTGGGKATAAPEAIPPVEPPRRENESIRNAAIAITGGAVAVALGAVAGVATVRRGRGRGWRPGVRGEDTSGSA